MQKFVTWLQKNRHICSGCCFLLAAALLLSMVLSTGTAPSGDDPAADPNTPVSLSMFTIVAEKDDLERANGLSASLLEQFGVTVPVAEADAYTGSYGIYLGTADYNSYGGYKYGISWEQTGEGAVLYLNGSDASLDAAINKLLKSGITDTSAFPFGLQEPVVGYEWNVEDVNMTALGFTIDESSSRELCEGVELRELKYKSFAYGKMSAYAVIVKSGAEAELKIAAADWNETHNADNPAPKHTVGEYAEMLQTEGYEVIAITNGGFYDLNTTKTNLPHGMQIVDGVVKKEPSQLKPNHSDNWFGMTKDGKYVISNTEGYESTYQGNVQQGIGGGLVLMTDGVPNYTSVGVDYRTAVGLTADGGIVIVNAEKANYAVLVQIFMDLDVDVHTILNMDGGGSTTMYTPDEQGTLTRLICETPLEREIADAIVVVKKK